MADPTADAPVVATPAATPGARPDRSAILAGMPFGEPKTEAKPAEVVKPAETAKTDEKAAEVEAKKPESDEDDDTSDKPKAEDVKDEPTDAEGEKRRAMLAKTEKKQRETLARERADAKAELASEVERVKAQLAPRYAAAEKFEAAAKRAKHDPVSALRSLGLTEEDFEHASRQLYYASPAAAKDPKNRVIAEQSLKERESATRQDVLEAKLAAMEAKEQAREQAAQLEQQKTRYVDEIAKGIPDDAPLLKKLHEKSPAKARAAMWSTAEKLYAETGEMPDADDVGAAYEKQRRAELEDLGIDVEAIIKAKPSTAAAVADPAKPAKTLSTTNGSAVRAPQEKKKTREELLKEMPWGAD